MIENGYKCPEKLKEVACYYNDEPEIEEFQFVEKSQFLPIFLPIHVRLEAGLAELAPTSIDSSLIKHVLLGHKIYLFP